MDLVDDVWCGVTLHELAREVMGCERARVEWGKGRRIRPSHRSSRGARRGHMLAASRDRMSYVSV